MKTLEQMTKRELLQYLQEFVPQHFWPPRPTRQDKATILRAILASQANRGSNNFTHAGGVIYRDNVAYVFVSRHVRKAQPNISDQEADAFTDRMVRLLRKEDQLREAFAFVEQMANFTTIYDGITDEEEQDNIAAERGDDMLCDEHNAFCKMIDKARELCGLPTAKQMPRPDDDALPDGANK